MLKTRLWKNVFLKHLIRGYNTAYKWCFPLGQKYTRDRKEMNTKMHPGGGRISEAGGTFSSPLFSKCSEIWLDYVHNWDKWFTKDMTGEMGPESGWSQREPPMWPGAWSCKAGPPRKPREGLWTSWHYLFKFLWIKNYLKIKIRKLAYTTTKTNQKKIFSNWNYIFDELIFAESLFGLI